MVDLPLNYKDFRPIMLGVLDTERATTGGVGGGSLATGAGH